MPDVRDPGVPPFSDALERELRRRVSRLPARRRWRRIGAVVAVASAVAIVSVLSLPSTHRPGTQAEALTVVLRNGSTVSINDVLSAKRLPAVSRSLDRTGLTLKIRELPVASSAEGRVLSVDWPAGVVIDDGRASVSPAARGDVVVTVGRPTRPGETSDSRGQSMLEANPHLCRFIDGASGPQTVRNLRAAGYGVTVVLVEFPADSSGKIHGPALERALRDPPEGSVVLTLADANFAVSKNPDHLAVEVVNPHKLPDSEPLGVDTGCM